METVIDIFNKNLIYNKNKINFLIDIDNNIWFKFISIANILNYKSNKDALRDHVEKHNKKNIKNINTIFKTNDHPDTIYINESGLYILLIKSRMKDAIKFQLWLINDVLPNLRKYGKVEVNKKIKLKLKNLNKKILLLKKYNDQLKKNMTKNKYPNGSHIYVIEDEGLYKIGYTDNLKKRLAIYNTGKVNKTEYIYYKKTQCAKEIELCLKAMLIKYIYKSKKEFYNCSLDKIIKAILKCIKIEKDCNNCKEIQIGGGEFKNNIIDNLINYYQEKYNKYNNIIV
jgi:prophage antirepressor-like protein